MPGTGAGVAAGHRLTAEAAAEALKDGGTAVDAAIAGLWTACFAEPVLSSPGGGGFLMIGAGDRTECLDFFVETPAEKPDGPIDAYGITADFGPATQAFTIGAGTSAVPGMIPGLFAAHERYGKLPMRVLTAFAAAAARDGMTIHPFNAHLFEIVSPILVATEEAKALFAAPGDEKTLAAGTVFRNPDLADALDEIASQGVKAATEGEVARLILAAQENGGTLTAASLATYRPEWRTPVRARVGQAEVFLNPPPSAGGSLIRDMLGRSGADASITARAAALFETDRAWVRAGRSIGRFLQADGPDRPNAHRGTTHVSVIDGDGMAVAATVSNGEGNGIIVPSCGFMVNNMLGEDDVNPAGVEGWVPGTRLSSMMAPSIARGANGALLAVGSGGSNRIRSAIYQVLVRHLAGGLPIPEAVEAARLHVEDGFVDFESHLPAADREWLMAHFPEHRVWEQPSLFFGGAHAVVKSAEGKIGGAGDPRRGGIFLAV